MIAWLISWEVRLVTKLLFYLYVARVSKVFSFILLPKQEHRELAREAVRKSLVLLKNGDSTEVPLLPLPEKTSKILPLPKKTSKILVAGSHADNLGYQCGGWTIEWQGLSGNDLTRGKIDG